MSRIEGIQFNSRSVSLRQKSSLLLNQIMPHCNQVPRSLESQSKAGCLRCLEHTLFSDFILKI